MLPFFARTLTRREMALGCAVLSLALLLSTLPAALRWGQAQLDTGALLCADTLRFQPPDKACCQFTCQIRVLTEILKIPPAERITFEIGSRPEDESDVLLPCLFADGRADLFQQLSLIHI